MHPVLVADIERKVYPLDQGHIAADGFDIVEEFRVVWGTPWAITEGNTLLSIEINGGARPCRRVPPPHVGQYAANRT